MPGIALDAAWVAETQRRHRSFKVDHPIWRPQQRHHCASTASTCQPRPDQIAITRGTASPQLPAGSLYGAFVVKYFRRCRASLSFVRPRHRLSSAPTADSDCRRAQRLSGPAVALLKPRSDVSRPRLDGLEHGGRLDEHGPVAVTVIPRHVECVQQVQRRCPWARAINRITLYPAAP